MLLEDVYPETWVFRMGHRPFRDKRITTHVSLLSRALCARGIYIDTADKELEGVVKGVVERFGGDFKIATGVKPKAAIGVFPGVVVHLTMYGEPFPWLKERIKKSRKLLVVVGAEKVPKWVYERADFNVSVTQQPHSEVAALGIFLHQLFGGMEKEISFPGAKEVILPSKGSKRVLYLSTPPLNNIKKTGKWIPTEEESLRILVDLGVPPAVIRHTIAVKELAEDVLKKAKRDLKVEKKVVIPGALLHDLGRAKSHDVDHGVIGANMLRKIGVDERIALIAERHLGAGISSDEARKMGLPVKDYMPQSAEEKLVTSIDNLIDDSNRVTLDVFVERMRRRGLKEVGERAVELQKELENLLKVDFDAIVKENNKK